ncbi:hypothetical protein [Clostridium saccharoperbutylacetonicum]|nr:hypothetical protein [Clostridium saccharoperbutylacetonicum]
MKKNLLRVGGWMKYKKTGFTIIESLVYTFLTTMILASGISLFISIYKSYVDAMNLSIKYNDCQNFFNNLDSIVSDGYREILVLDNNTVLFSNNNVNDNLDKVIKSNEGKIYVKYMRNNSVETIKTVLDDIDNMEIKKNGKLIYFIIHDKDGKEFIKCF